MAQPRSGPLKALDSEKFGSLVPSLIFQLGKSIFDAETPENDTVLPEDAHDAILSRAAEPPTIAAISSTISNPIQTKDDFYTTCFGLGHIIGEFPLATLPHYRPVLQTLAAMDPALAPPEISLSSLSALAKDVLYFMDNPDLAWAPKHKADIMAERSLTERVLSAEQMKPYAVDLLGWLADMNWPPFPGCVKQLARFPEVTIEPIRQIMTDNADDAMWLLHLLEFVEHHVPVGSLWESLRPQLETLADLKAEDEDARDVSESAARCLNRLHEWQVAQGK